MVKKHDRPKEGLERAKACHQNEIKELRDLVRDRKL